MSKKMNWDRALPAAGTLLLPVAAVFALFSQSIAAMALLGAFGLLVVVVLGKRGSSRGDVDWGPSRDEPSEAAKPEAGSVARALAVVEMRELMLSPWFAAGIGFCVVFGTIAASAFDNSWWMAFGLMPLLIHPLSGMTIVATHRAVTRARRDDALELFDSCPATRTQRNAAHLLTFPLPVGVGLIFVSATLVTASVILDHMYGPIDLRAASDAVIAVLLPGGAVALGVLLGRRTPFALAPFVAIALIALLNIEMADRGLDGRGWLTTGIATGAVDFIYFEPPAIGRVVWIAGLTIVVASLALRTRGNTRSALAVTFGAVVALVGLVVTVQPLSAASAERLTDYVINPSAYETCSVVSQDITVCALDPYRDHGAAIAAYLDPMVAAIPPGVIEEPITMRLLVGDGLEQLPSQVRERIVPTPLPDGTVPLQFTHHDGGFLPARFMLASAATMLPISEDPTHNLLVGGEARGVVTLWLATFGLPTEEARNALTPDEYNDPTSSGQGHIWPGCITVVQWSPQDVAAARSLLTADPDVVQTVIVDGWNRWTAPTATTDDLLAELGLPLVGPPSEIEQLGDACT